LAISKPEVFNTDQGSQFTSQAFTGVLEDSLSRGALKPAIDGRFKTGQFRVDVVDLTPIVGLLQDSGWFCSRDPAGACGWF
jgi:transposase InsO family protein